MKESKYLVAVNEKHQFEISSEQANTLDFVKIDSKHFHILRGQKSYRAEIVEANFQKKIFKIKIDGNLHNIIIADKFDQLVERLGLSVIASSKVTDVKAPMPGLVLDINVATGQEVNKGDKLMILEAMKMENVIKSEGIGIVKEIHVEKGAIVEKGQMLIEMS
jgi:biotin carboxyl carrier protein